MAAWPRPAINITTAKAVVGIESTAIKAATGHAAWWPADHAAGEDKVADVRIPEKRLSLNRPTAAALVVPATTAGTNRLIVAKRRTPTTWLTNCIVEGMACYAAENMHRETPT